MKRNYDFYLAEQFLYFAREFLLRQNGLARILLIAFCHFSITPDDFSCHSAKLLGEVRETIEQYLYQQAPD